jgi:hypothetical protein
MVVVSILTLSIGLGGYTDRNAFAFVAILLVMFWGLPLLGLIVLFHFLEWRYGSYARFSVALIGFLPLLLVVFFGGSGVYAGNLILSGWAWSAAWLITSYFFTAVPEQLVRVLHSLAAFGLAVLVLLLCAWIISAIVTKYGSHDRQLAETPAPRHERKVFGEIAGAKLLRCHDHECTVLTCREGKCVETGRLVPQN